MNRISWASLFIGLFFIFGYAYYSAQSQLGELMKIMGLLLGLLFVILPFKTSV